MLSERPSLQLEVLAVWLKSHADGSAHTRRAYAHRLEVSASSSGGIVMLILGP
jgi:hypothetical protein